MEQKISSSKSTEKTTVFNLIVLDESGSMGGLVQQTISGCNETLNVARAAVRVNGDKIRSLVSIYAFQSGTEVPSRYLVKNVPAGEVRDITDADYRPYGATPLLDAVGSTLSELKAVADTHENSTAIVTIITDGYENDSHMYTGPQVAKLISQLKELGWTINLIGANIDVEEMGKAMNIENRMAFSASKEGTQMMYDALKHNVDVRYCEIASEDDAMPMSQRIERRKMTAKSFFKKRTDK